MTKISSILWGLRQREELRQMVIRYKRQVKTLMRKNK